LLPPTTVPSYVPVVVTVPVVDGGGRTSVAIWTSSM
jgi:hypothetical protein